MKRTDFDFNSVCTALIVLVLIVLFGIAAVQCDKTNRTPKTGLTWVKDANGIEHSIK